MMRRFKFVDKLGVHGHEAAMVQELKRGGGGSGYVF